ncbi:MAG: biopolymer transporter ExbD [Cellvibrio sp.]|jgi:biopolymer transport protein ExbD
MRIKRRHKREEADLDVTSFMNLMIILVPVLLISMVLARTTVLDLKLPDLADSSTPQEEEPQQQLELVIRKDYLDVNYPAGVRLKRVDKTAEGEHDYKLLSLILQEVKRNLEEKGVEKKDIFILSEKDTPYQTLVTAMDTARSFKAVVAASVVNAELFPEISLGDAPEGESTTAAQGGRP